MSFSSEVKEEISKLNNLANKEVVKFELLGYIITNNITVEKSKLKFSTENEYNINRFSKLLNNLQYISHKIEVTGKVFGITVVKIEMPEILYSEEKIGLNAEKIQSLTEKNELLEKAIVRGSFLGGGSISNPKNTHHLEIIFSSEQNAQIVLEILNKYQIMFKLLKKKNAYSIYTKDGDEISNFLALIGATSSVLKFEDIRVYRNVRNNVNRKVNCETANINKTVNAALKQIEDIEYLKEKGELDKLSEPLKEIAKLRIENPEASLIELGKMLLIPLGKSGVNYRLQVIQKKAEELRRNK